MESVGSHDVKKGVYGIPQPVFQNLHVYAVLTKQQDRAFFQQGIAECVVIQLRDPLTDCFRVIGFSVLAE